MDHIFNPEGTQTSRTASATVLTTLAQLYHEKHKSPSTKKKSEGNEEDDEITLQHSDEEEGSETVESPLIEVLKHHLP